MPRMAGHAWWVLVEGADAEQARVSVGLPRGDGAAIPRYRSRFSGLHLPRDAPASAQPPMDGGRWIDLVGEPAGQPGEARVDFERCWQRMWLHSRMVAESTGKETATKRVQNVRWSSG
jgi:hypothetical protein